MCCMCGLNLLQQLQQLQLQLAVGGVEGWKEMRSKELRRDGEVRNPSREERKMIAIVR